MDLFSELVVAVQSDFNVGAETNLFDPATIKLALNRAYRKAAGFYKWPETRDAKKTSSISNQEYYDYPQNWKSDSIWKLTVDGTDYGEPIAFKSYLHEQENNFSSGLTKLWTNQKRRYFISPTPSSNGDNNICIWGFKQPDQLVADDDVTIFSYDMPECNEAVILEALAILRIKGGEQPIRLLRYVQGSLFLSIEAQQILTTAWGKIAMENAKYEQTIPAFDVPDFFANRSNNRQALRNRIGNF